MKHLSKKWVWSSMSEIGTDRIVSSLRDLSGMRSCLVRKLKHTVNKVSSLRDLGTRFILVRRLRFAPPTVNKVMSLRDFGGHEGLSCP
jgi:hypothetical protein